MQESGGRRIKRSLFLDQHSLRFLDEPEVAQIREFNILRDYIDAKCFTLAEWNVALSRQGVPVVNARRITNLGTFRAYVEHYLRANPHIHHDMTLLVRQLQPTPLGLPLEIYCFANDTSWVAYEQIHSDIGVIAGLWIEGFSKFQRRDVDGKC